MQRLPAAMNPDAGLLVIGTIAVLMLRLQSVELFLFSPVCGNFLSSQCLLSQDDDGVLELADALGLGIVCALHSAEPLHLVFYIVVIPAFGYMHGSSGQFGNLGRERIDDEAIMGNEDDAAAIFLKHADEHHSADDVDMVFRLIQ